MRTEGFWRLDGSSDGLFDDSGSRGGNDDKVGAAAIRNASLHVALSIVGLERIQASSAPKLPRQSRAVSRIVSVATTRAPGAFASIVNISPIGPWPRTTHKIAGLRVGL